MHGDDNDDRFWGGAKTSRRRSGLERRAALRSIVSDRGFDPDTTFEAARLAEVDEARGAAELRSIVADGESDPTPTPGPKQRQD